MKRILILAILLLGQVLEAQVMQYLLDAEKEALKNSNVQYFIKEVTTFKTSIKDEEKSWVLGIVNEEGLKVGEAHYDDKKKLTYSTQFTYDNNHKLVEIIHRSPEGDLLESTEYYYDLTGRHTETIKREEGNILYRKFPRYNPDGTPKYVQILLHKLTRVNNSVISTPINSSDLFVDYFNYSEGKLTSIQEPNRNTEYTYNKKGQIIEFQKKTKIPVDVYWTEFIFKHFNEFNELGLIEEKDIYTYSVLMEEGIHSANQQYTYFTEELSPKENGFELPQNEQYKVKKSISQHALYLKKVEDFPGGLEGLHQFAITAASRYSNKIDPKNHGCVALQLSINQDGTIKEYNIINEPSPRAIKNAEKILKKKFPLWKPEGKEQNSGPFETIISFSF